VGEATVPIGDGLRFVFFGLECALGVTLYPLETERVFRDARADQVSAKAYRLHESPRLRVLGRVDEYEPDTIVLRVEGRRGTDALLRRVVTGAADQVVRMCRAAAETSSQVDVAPDPRRP
jgi:hypothetical protein